MSGINEKYINDIDVQKLNIKIKDAFVLPYSVKLSWA